jgi:predicted Holliday junction resolvase-like endonuclease
MVLEFILALSTVGATSGIGYWIFNRVLKSKQAKFNKLLEQREIEHNEQLKLARKEEKDKAAKSLKRSKEVLTGLAAEQIAPHLESFPFYPGDCRPMGSPIDFVAFPGSVKEDVEKVVLIEVKTGKSRLSKKQKQIKKVVEDGKVEFLEFRIPTDPIKLRHHEELVDSEECLCSECVDGYLEE